MFNYAIILYVRSPPNSGAFRMEKLSQLSILQTDGRSKTSRGYVKPRIITKAIYNFIFV